MNNMPSLLALHSVNGLGPVRLKLLLDYFKDPKLVWEAKQSELQELGLPKNTLQNLLEKRKTLDPEKYAQEIKNSGIKILTIYDENYPALLKQIYDSPIVLYFWGEIPQTKRAIGVVGTRKITGYGRTVTDKFTKELTKTGFVIVSGLARGVDTQAHKAAIEAEGQTVAVLGGGLNHLYPPENKELAKKISQGFGAVITEFPPDAQSMPGNFPARNRIIAGLSLGVLITEADINSGSLITARLALEEGREVFAVPGPITSNLSSGTSQLIKEGAKLVTSAEDILESLGIDSSSLRKSSILSPQTEGQGSRKTADGLDAHFLGNNSLTELEKQILECLENEEKHMDEICRELKKPSAEISATLVKLEIMGVVKNMGGGNYTRSI